jgi:hypothetical protein
MMNPEAYFHDAKNLERKIPSQARSMPTRYRKTPRRHHQYSREVLPSGCALYRVDFRKRENTNE